jgi:CheY-specific phosphatase CheX
VRVQLDEESLVKASLQFWEQMLAMTLKQVPICTKFCVGTRHLLGSVNLSGVWKGRIEVRLTEGLAQSATAAMLMLPVEEVADSDTIDATKEIANMIAGTIKSSLPRPCSMTVPEAAVELDDFCDSPETESTLAVAFEHDDGGLMVRIIEEDYTQPPVDPAA